MFQTLYSEVISQEIVPTYFSIQILIDDQSKIMNGVWNLISYSCALGNPTIAERHLEKKNTVNCLVV